jgi:glycosyltransferase involved in cell wall biosynthesis
LKKYGYAVRRLKSLIALLGRQDLPTDGIQDYSEFLSRALERRGVGLTIVRVDWTKKGWASALIELWQSSKKWRGDWIILQYAAFAWSSRGFPFGALAVLGVLRWRGARCAVMFHEQRRVSGARWVDRVRGACQSYVVRSLYRNAEKAIFAASLETIEWLPKNERKAICIPIGSNVSESGPVATPVSSSHSTLRTVVVFCVTGAPHSQDEVSDIARATRDALTGGVHLRVIFLGRGTIEAGEEIARAFRDIPVEVCVKGVLPRSIVSDILAKSDAMLCVRGALFPTRGSAIAGISSGLPVIGYRGPETHFPITEGGVELVQFRDSAALGLALRRVLLDDALRNRLKEKSVKAHAAYFSWDRIAERFLEELSNG